MLTLAYVYTVSHTTSTHNFDTHARTEFIVSKSEEDLGAEFSYSNTAGVAMVKSLGPMLGHVFNHATHHRGQVSGSIFLCVCVQLCVICVVVYSPPRIRFRSYVRDILGGRE